MEPTKLSLEEITKLGEKFYKEQKDSLEKQHMGKYVVLDVEQNKYIIDSDRLVAVEKAKKEYGDKLFYIIQIGNTQNPSLNYSEKKYAWLF